MFIILTYDIGRKRVGKALKICRKYLVHVQKSVFEGHITPANYNRLKQELEHLVDTDFDSVIIYQLMSTKFAYKEQLGIVEQNPYIL